MSRLTILINFCIIFVMNVHSNFNIHKDSPKREQILVAALTLVSQHGFHGTSMSMLASEANCGAGTIYNYFKSKDDLMEALFRKLKTDFITAIMAGDHAQEPLQQRFMCMWKNAIRYFLEYPENAVFFQQFHSSPYFNQQSAEFALEAIRPLISIFENAMRNGIIRAVPQPVLESLTIDLATSLARRHVNGEIMLDDPLIEETGNACWRSLLAE
jgi:AcrR family transcriptional regulator